MALWYINATDEREIITNIVATSNIDLVAKYGLAIEAPTFDIAEGTEAEIQEGSWYHYENGKWMVRENNYQFNSGRWQYRTKVNRTYYYKVRAYATINGKRVYGNYNAVKYAKVLPMV